MADAFVLDRALILERLGGDEEIFSMMLDMYIQDVESNCDILEAAFVSGDAAALQREAHTVKGLLATFSDDIGSGDALLIEQLAKDGNVSGLGGAVRSLQERMRVVADVLKAEIARSR